MVDGAPRDIALVVDVLVTWVGAAALGRYAWMLGAAGSHSLLERRARLLVGLMAAALFVRGFAWIIPDHPALDFLVFAPVSLLPLAMTLFAEALLRRHAPRWIKAFAATATIAAFAASMLRGVSHSPSALTAIGGTVLVGLVATMFALAWLLVERDHASLSAAENALVRICALITAFGIPLAVTDFRTAFGTPPVRLGTIGALVFCYSLLRRPEENSRLRDWARDLARLVAKAVVACAVLALALGTTKGSYIIPLSVLAIAVILAFAIFDNVRDSVARTTNSDLLRWLSGATPRTMAEFSAELARLPITQDASIVDESELGAYDRGALVATFGKGRVAYALAELRRMREGRWGRARGADELTDLLERRGATHVALLSASPLRLLVATVPELGHADEVELALSAVARRGERAVSP